MTVLPLALSLGAGGAVAPQPEPARALQKQYFREHGTTMRGLMEEQGSALSRAERQAVSAFIAATVLLSLFSCVL